MNTSNFKVILIKIMKIINKKNEKSLIDEFVANFKKDILKKNKAERFSFVLTGGKSPIKLYEKLSSENINWDQIDFFWGDERYVSHNSKNSNYKMAFNRFIKKIKISKKNIYPIFTKKKINLCSKDYSKKIKNYFKNKKISFDYFLLGMGNDGHIASIFPGDINFFDKFISLPVVRNDFKRITLSLNVINNSKKIILWLNKKSKSEKFKRLKIQGKKIPFNNLNKKKTTVYKIV